ncbi:hypothetical protein GCM10009564_45440 [Streptomyces thermogriseus]|uniref:Uncharacterized protein n=1 Tax=Streptomyces thermogriseus TaxID=75292 RepID=A0ABP4DMI9_9ACTN
MRPDVMRARGSGEGKDTERGAGPPPVETAPHRSRGTGPVQPSFEMSLTAPLSALVAIAA